MKLITGLQKLPKHTTDIPYVKRAPATATFDNPDALAKIDAWAKAHGMARAPAIGQLAVKGLQTLQD